MMKKLLFILSVFAWPILVLAQPTNQTFSTPGNNFSYVVPPGYSATLEVFVWGGGGGGGATGNGDARGGGGGGGYAERVFTNVGPGSYAVIVGSGGGAGNNGTLSSAAFSVTLTGNGGTAGGTDSGGGGGTATGGTINVTGGTGGASGGFNKAGGGGGGSGINATAGVTPSGAFKDTGGAGGTPGPGGTGGNTGTSGAANNGSIGAGGGGRGYQNTATSGSGANGRVFVSVVSSAPLPIELTSFTSRPVSQSVELKWNTASEVNNEKFLIERSSDGQKYTTIGEVSGHGTTTEPQSYHFLDERPAAGINYYRLKQMDYDGGFEYSPIQSVAFRKSGEILVYPTITTGELQVVLPSESSDKTTLLVYSLQGALLSEQVLDGNGINFTVTLPEMPSGQYIVEVKSGALSSKTRIFKG